jgi:hypothetical protein
MKSKHLLIASLSLAGAAVVVAVVLAMTGESEKDAALRRHAEFEQQLLEEQVHKVTPEEVTLAKQLRDRAAAIRQGRQGFPDANRLAAAAATDAKGSCPHPVPALQLGHLFVPAIELAPRSKQPWFRPAGLAERMEAVANRLESTAVEPRTKFAREDASALLAAPAHEIILVVERLDRPRAVETGFRGPHEPPGGFAPGSVMARVVLVDVDAGVPLCAGEVGAASSNKIDFTYNPDFPAIDVDQAIYDDFWQHLTENLAKVAMHPLKLKKKKSI